MNTRLGLRLVAAAFLGAGIVGGTFALSACSDDDSETTTPGFRVDLGTRIEIEGGLSHTNAFDWDIELSKVVLSSGPIYYFDGSPIETAALHPAPARPPGTRVFEWFAPRVAHAHPGHYDEGEAKGEMLEAASFDLAVGPASLPTGEGTSGVFRSARFTWASPATGPLAAELGGSVLILEGTAEKGTSLVSFRLEASEADVLDSAGEPSLEGCTFDEANVQSNGTVTVRVDPSVWLNQAEFDDVLGDVESGPVLIPRDHPASKAFVRGIKKSSAVRFSFEAN